MRRGVIASAQAHNRQQRELAVREWSHQVDVRAAARAARAAVVAHDPAAHAVAEEDHMSPDGPAEDQVVEGRDAVEVRRRSCRDARRYRVRLSSETQPRCAARSSSPRRRRRALSGSAPLRSISPISRRSASRSLLIDPRPRAQNRCCPRSRTGPPPRAPGRSAAASEMRKRRRTNAGAIGHRAAVTDQVVAVVALGRLDAPKRFARGNHGAPAHAQESA